MKEDDESESSFSKTNSEVFSREESLKIEEEVEYKIERNLKDEQKFDIKIKLIVLGDSNVGKSSIINRICLEKFDTNTIPTIGAELQNFFIKINDQIIRINIWDTAGQEAFKAIIKKHYQDADVCLFVYSVDDIKSFNSIKSWYKEVLENNSKAEKNEMISILLGNKKDVDEDQRKVSKEEGENSAKEYNFFLFKEISCKSGNKEEIENIYEILDKIGKYYYDKFKETGSSMRSDSFNFAANQELYDANKKDKKQKKKKKCC
jgi:small GTP-binding protein